MLVCGQLSRLEFWGCSGVQAAALEAANLGALLTRSHACADIVVDARRGRSAAALGRGHAYMGCSLTAAEELGVQHQPDELAGGAALMPWSEEVLVPQDDPDVHSPAGAGADAEDDEGAPGNDLDNGGPQLPIPGVDAAMFAIIQAEIHAAIHDAAAQQHVPGAQNDAAAADEM